VDKRVSSRGPYAPGRRNRRRGGRDRHVRVDGRTIDQHRAARRATRTVAVERLLLEAEQRRSGNPATALKLGIAAARLDGAAFPPHTARISAALVLGPKSVSFVSFSP
jgi:hypothetical protein